MKLLALEILICNTFALSGLIEQKNLRKEKLINVFFLNFEFFKNRLYFRAVLDLQQNWAEGKVIVHLLSASVWA